MGESSNNLPSNILSVFRAGAAETCISLILFRKLKISTSSRASFDLSGRFKACYFNYKNICNIKRLQ